MRDFIYGFIKGGIIGILLVIGGALLLAFFADKGWWGLFWALVPALSILVLWLFFILVPRLVCPRLWHHSIPGNMNANLEFMRRWLYPLETRRLTGFQRRMEIARQIDSARKLTFGICCVIAVSLVILFCV